MIARILLKRNRDEILIFVLNLLQTYKTYMQRCITAEHEKITQVMI
jgi:hypothetical protein